MTLKEHISQVSELPQLEYRGGFTYRRMTGIFCAVASMKTRMTSKKLSARASGFLTTLLPFWFPLSISWWTKASSLSTCDGARV